MVEINDIKAGRISELDKKIIQLFDNVSIHKSSSHSTLHCYCIDNNGVLEKICGVSIYACIYFTEFTYMYLCGERYDNIVRKKLVEFVEKLENTPLTWKYDNEMKNVILI